MPSIGLTFGDVAELYIEGHVRTAARKIDAQRVMEYHIDALKRAQIPAGNATQIALHAKPIEAIMKSDVEHIRREWIAHRPGSKQGRGRAKPTVGASTASIPVGYHRGPCRPHAVLTAWRAGD